MPSGAPPPSGSQLSHSSATPGTAILSTFTDGRREEGVRTRAVEGASWKLPPTSPLPPPCTELPHTLHTGAGGLGALSNLRGQEWREVRERTRRNTGSWVLVPRPSLKLTRCTKCLQRDGFVKGAEGVQC